MELEKWWYIVPEEGQHISFYHQKTLGFIAHLFNLNLYSNQSSLHLFTKEKLKSDPFKIDGKQNIFQRFLKGGKNP